MAITYSPNLKLTLIGTGDQAGTWGNTTNTNIGTLIEQSIAGYVSQTVADSAGSPTSLSIADGTDSVARNMALVLQGALSANRDLILPTNKKLYFIHNNTSGGFSVTVKCSGQTGVSIPSGAKVALVCNGVDIVEAINYIGNLILPSSLTIATLSGTTLGYASASLTNASVATLIGTTFSGGSASITTVSGTTATYSSVLGTIIGTTASSTLRGASGFVGQLTVTSATITNLNVTSLTGTTFPLPSSATITTLNGTTLNYTSATITNLNVTSLTAGSIPLPSSGTIATLSGTTLGYASASLTTATGTTANFTTIGTKTSSTIRGSSGEITQFTATSATITNLNVTNLTGTTFPLPSSGTIATLSGTTLTASGGGGGGASLAEIRKAVSLRTELGTKLRLSSRNLAHVGMTVSAPGGHGPIVVDVAVDAPVGLDAAHQVLAAFA